MTSSFDADDTQLKSVSSSHRSRERRVVDRVHLPRLIVLSPSGTPLSSPSRTCQKTTSVAAEVVEAPPTNAFMIRRVDPSSPETTNTCTKQESPLLHDWAPTFAANLTDGFSVEECLLNSPCLDRATRGKNKKPFRSGATSTARGKNRGTGNQPANSMFATEQENRKNGKRIKTVDARKAQHREHRQQQHLSKIALGPWLFGRHLHTRNETIR